MAADASRPLYADMGSYLAARFPYKVQKISLHAGFSCPNRDGTKGRGGCTYCNNQTFSPDYCHTGRSITEQLDEGIAFFARKYPDMKYLAYFQAYTNTYGATPYLAACYEEALAHEGVVGLIIGTRPDCMPPDLLAYLSDLARDRYLMVEYGIESSCDVKLARVNRVHDYASAVDAVRRTAEAGIPVGAHMILGLPGESRETILSHAGRLSALPLTMVKLHQLQLIRGTRLAQEYEQGVADIYPYTVTEYVDLAIDFIERLRPDIVVERFVSQSPDALLIAPRWGLKNHEFTARLLQRMRERNTWQGRLWAE